jgi:hypothetical protein
MIDWYPHRGWIGVLTLAVIIGICNAPVLGLAQQRAGQKLAGLRAENAQTSQALRQLQDDIEAANKMKTEMDINEAESLLAPVDRLRAAQILEHRAAESRLIHFTYTLSPEEKVQIETADAGKQELATSKWTLAADAPTDTDAYAFIDAIIRTLPGRVTLHQISLQRTGAENAVISAANLHLTASGDWLSNGANPHLAQVK